LTPPSALFSYGYAGAPIISQFLEDQRFDLQATISLDPGQTLSAAHFLVDGELVPGTVSVAPATTPGRVVVSLRAYANSQGGEHRLSIAATQSDDQSVTATGNFNVVKIKSSGMADKN